MPPYKTPGVYVEEISTLPPSVAEVATAIPAFIGYTAIGPDPDSGPPVVRRFSTLLEFESAFGKAPPTKFKVVTRTTPANPNAPSVSAVERQTPGAEFSLYYAVSHYLKNGGGAFYVVSVGDYDDTPAKEHFLAGLSALEKEDEPTLIVPTDAARTLTKSSDYYEVCGAALAQCRKLGDRFTLLDVVGGDVVAFRNDPNLADNLLYGAAYHPYLQTSLGYAYQETAVSIMDEGGGSGGAAWESALGDNGVLVTFKGAEGSLPKVRCKSSDGAAEITVKAGSDGSTQLDIKTGADKKGKDLAAAWTAWKQDSNNDPGGFELTVRGDGEGEVATTSGNSYQELQRSASGLPSALAGLRVGHTALYNEIKARLSEQRVVLPPSAAVAGIYARVDRERGVWKAPANVGVVAVLGPVTKVTHDQQEDLNVDPTGGKSINAIREFTGKGVLVWGARTLAGNDNEWRYVPVRRLFNLIEESTRKATAFAVFEPNDSATWLKVKAMIESYLYGLWERGALAGSTPEAAYFVNVGLGTTMTPQNVLEGIMIVEIGAAAVRPAEFIVLRFTHKLQQA